MNNRFIKDLQEVPVTFALIFIHINIYILLLLQDPNFGALILNPSGMDLLRDFGAQINSLVWNGEYYRLFTSAFLHGGLLHLIMNNAALFVLGRLLERLFGSVYFLILYLLSLYAGSLASLLWSPPYVISVGSSGAIMGLAGSLMVILLLDYQNRFIVATLFGKIFFFILILFNLFSGEFVEIINSTAHFGGFIMGVAFTIFLWSRFEFVALPRIAGNIFLLLSLLGLLFFSYKGFFPQNSRMWHLHIAWQAYQKGDAPQAEKHFLIALKQKEDQHILTRLAFLYEQTHQWKKASVIYSKLTKKNPDNITLWFQLINSLTKAGLPQKAEKAYFKVQKKFSKQLQREEIRLMFLLALEREKEAILAYQRLLDLQPRDPNLNNALAWLLVTAKNPNYRNPHLAYKYAKIAVTETHRNVGAYLDTLAEVLFQLGKPKEALRIERYALKTHDAQLNAIHFHRQIQKFLAALKPTSKPTKRLLPATSQPAKRLLPATKRLLPATSQPVKHPQTATSPTH